MNKPKKKTRRDTIIGMITFVPSILLLITFISLVSTNTTLTGNIYSTLVFSFVFGALGLLTSVLLIFARS